MLLTWMTFLGERQLLPILDQLGAILASLADSTDESVNKLLGLLWTARKKLSVIILQSHINNEPITSGQSALQIVSCLARADEQNTLIAERSKCTTVGDMP